MNKTVCYLFNFSAVKIVHSLFLFININLVMNLKYFIFLLLFILVSGLKAQVLRDEALTENSFRVDSIKIQGNKKTLKKTILRELSFSVGDTVTQSDLQFNSTRIYSLGLFNKVEIYANRIADKNIVVIDVRESWYFYPIPFIDLANNDIKRASYGVDFLWQNMSGKAEKANFIFSLGYNPQLVISYLNPLFFFNNDLGLIAKFAYKKISNKSLILLKILGKDFNYTDVSAEVGINKKFNQFNEMNFILGYQYVAQPFKELSYYTASKTGFDRLPLLKVNYSYDTRNLKQFSELGSYYLFQVIYKGFNFNKISYFKYKIDLREYSQIKGLLTARLRLLVQKSFGWNVPYYDHSFFGYNEIVRGNKSKIKEGENLVKFSFELSYPIIKTFLFSIKLPLLPVSLTTFDFGLKINFFYDAGKIFDRRFDFSKQNFQQGFGVGLNLLFLPYNIVRFEIAFDEELKGEILLGTGFSF